MIPKEDIHIFIPAFNEEQTIDRVIKEVKSCGYPHLYIVNDGSTDRTTENAREAGAHVIPHFINRGAGAATQTAIECAKKLDLPFMILMDGDGQHQPEDINILMQRMDRGDCDIVIGSRFQGDISNMPRSRKVFNRIANFLTNLFCENRYTDTQSGFRMLNRRAIENLQLTVDEYGFCSEMLILAEQKRLKIVEVPSTTIYTPYSLSKGQNFYAGVETALHFIWKVIFK